MMKAKSQCSVGDDRPPHLLDEHTRLFEEHRSLLLGVVYRMLGTAADAEDLVHDTYLRWRETDLAGVRSPRNYLITVATRLAIDYLRSARVRRESYTGQWLPEPLGGSYLPEVVGNIELAESLQTAFMLLLERLNATQRAAYLLYEVFELEHAEVARILEISAENSRQLVRRARMQLSEGRSRYESSPERIEEVTQRFLEVCEGAGSIEAFMELLADDVVFMGDGGGRVQSLPNPVHGAELVARLMAAFLAKNSEGTMLRLERVSGQPAVVASRDLVPWAVVTLAVAGGRITMVDSVVNPEKLRTLMGAGGLEVRTR
jgi:RNA polymerase sigma-70 factor (ECF subfamily)